MGTSAGGTPALLEIVSTLPANFPGSIFIVQHFPPYAPSHLPSILSSAGYLKALHPEDGEPIESGTIYIAPPGHDMLLEPGKILVTNGPKENQFRPSIDALFRSAAYVYGPKTIGVILSGILNDGTSGLWTVQRLGGMTVVQAPRKPNSRRCHLMLLNILPQITHFRQMLLVPPSPGTYSKAAILAYCSTKVWRAHRDRQVHFREEHHIRPGYPGPR